MKLRTRERFYVIIIEWERKGKDKWEKMKELWALVLNHRDFHNLFNILEIISGREIFYPDRHAFI